LYFLQKKEVYRANGKPLFDYESINYITICLWKAKQNDGDDEIDYSYEIKFSEAQK